MGFDCASRYNAVSLNRSLLSDPNLTSSLIGVLTRFPEKSVAIMTDVETMFLKKTEIVFVSVVARWE